MKLLDNSRLPSGEYGLARSSLSRRQAGCGNGVCKSILTPPARPNYFPVDILGIKRSVLIICTDCKLVVKNTRDIYSLIESRGAWAQQGRVFSSWKPAHILKYCTFNISSQLSWECWVTLFTEFCGEPIHNLRGTLVGHTPMMDPV